MARVVMVTLCLGVDCAVLKMQGGCLGSPGDQVGRFLLARPGGGQRYT